MKYFLDHPQIKRNKAWGNKHPAKKQKKAAKVMREYHAGELKSSSGEKVKSPEQAKAIAMSESGLAKEDK